MFMTSLKRWKGSIFVLVPVIAGLILMGAPMDPAWAKPGKNKGPGPSPPPPSPTDNLFNNEVRALARAAGLESLRVAITVKDGVNDSWTPLLLNPGRVPLPNDLNSYLNSKEKNARKIATQLGKALFFEQAIGSDGQACASCHFHAGVDNRTKNQLNPSITRFENVRDAGKPDVIGFHFAADAPDFVFHEPAATPTSSLDGAWGPNYTLLAEDFPFVKDIDNGDNVDDSASPIIGPVNPPNTNDVASSQGVFFTEFESVVQESVSPFALGSSPVKIRDKGTPIADIPANGGAGFQVNDINVRRVEPRNTPTTVNAVFNFHQFWDGRANNRFNGVTPFGDTDREARIFVRGGGRGGNANLATRNISLKNASLASQAVGPPLSHFEASFGNPGDANPLNDRIWPDIGKKMLGSPFPINDPPRERKLLESQEVFIHVTDSAKDDSLLGELRRKYGAFDGNEGIDVTYRQLIMDAFNPNLWDSDRMIAFPGVEVLATPPFAAFQKLGDAVILSPAEAQALVASGVLAEERVFTQMEANFSLFFGLAVMLYEAELVADQSPFDLFMEGNDGALGPKEILGLLVFINADQLLADGIIVDPAEFPLLNAFLGPGGLPNGKCVNCHGGPEFTNASVRNTQGPAGNNIIEPMLMGNLEPAFYDNGFYNIGVTPTTDDRGRGGKGPEDKPLASSRQFLFKDNNINGPINFPIIGLPIMNLVPGACVETVGSECVAQELRTVEDDILVCIDLNMDNVCDIGDEIVLQRVAVDGAFKTPSIRNQELQGPYMHNGGLKSLVEVVQFYDRGGNFCRFNFDDLDPDIQFIGLSEPEEEGLVAFMLATTDPRVKIKAAPFDHPELRIPNGHPGDHTGVTADTDFSPFLQATDHPLPLQAVGAEGGPTLEPFLNVNHFTDFGVVASKNVGSTGEPKCSDPRDD